MERNQFKKVFCIKPILRSACIALLSEIHDKKHFVITDIDDYIIFTADIFSKKPLRIINHYDKIMIYKFANCYQQSDGKMFEIKRNDNLFNVCIFDDNVKVYAGKIDIAQSNKIAINVSGDWLSYLINKES